MAYDGQRSYSGNRRGCSPSSLAGSAHSNDLQPPDGMDSCGWEDGRWSGQRLDRIHTSDSPDSWRNQSSPPRLHEWRTLLEPFIMFIMKHIVVHNSYYYYTTIMVALAIIECFTLFMLQKHQLPVTWSLHITTLVKSPDKPLLSEGNIHKIFRASKGFKGSSLKHSKMVLGMALERTAL